MTATSEFNLHMTTSHPTSALFLTKPNDTHARVVKTCLDKIGIKCTRWFGGDFPVRSQIALRVSANGDADTLVVHNANEVVRLDDFNVVWCRRPSAPTVPDGLDPDDVEIVKRENVAFLRSALAYLSGNGFWINDYRSRLLADNKPVQLAAARRAGFAIPESVFGNCSSAVLISAESQ